MLGMTTVAVVVLDTLRYDRFEEHFQWLDGQRFTEAYSTSHWTVPAHGSLFTGEYASNVSVTGRSPTLECEKRTLAEAFQDDGYQTRCLSANAQLNQYEGWDRGFEEFARTANLGRIDEDIFDWDGHIRSTKPGFRRHMSGAVRCLTEDVDTVRSLQYGLGLFRRPRYDGGITPVRRRVANTSFGEEEFLFINLMETHTPYHPPPGESDAVSVVVAEALADAVDDPDRIRDAYDASVRYLSREYRKLYSDLQDSFEYVITLSDHGELLGEHGLWNHSVSLHPELLHIPLVISGEGVEDGENETPVNLLDLHRTIGDLCGLAVDSEGRNILDDPEPRELLFESHGVLPFHRGQFERYGLPESEFDWWNTPLQGFLSTDGVYCYEPDPERFLCLGETALSDPREHLDELGTQLDNAEEGDPVEVSPAVKKRLEELGYA